MFKEKFNVISIQVENISSLAGVHTLMSPNQSNQNLLKTHLCALHYALMTGNSA
jgi:hypothetical protein